MEQQQIILDKFINYDKKQLNKLHSKIIKLSNELYMLEVKFNIKGFEGSRGLNYPNGNIKAEALKRWTELSRLAQDLDYLFLED